jgi:TPR repeat protein
MYAESHGVPQDFIEGAKWYRLAAEQGYPQAMYYLGLACARGEGVPQNNVSAHMWLNLAATRFPASEIRNRGLAARNRDLVASKMTAEEIIAAQTLAREWKPK